MASAAFAKNLKMASISDIHLFPEYDATKGAGDYCWPYGDTADVVDYFGRWSCDLPEVTIRLLL